MEMIQNVGINILAAIIYDVSKYLFGRSSDKRINLEKITKEFNQKFKKSYDVLYDSKEFNSLFKNPCIKDIVENFILFSTTGKLLNNNGIRYDSANTENKIIECLYNELINEYPQNADELPDKEMVINFFNDYFDFVNVYLYNKLSFDGKIHSYLLSRTIYNCQESIIFHIQELENSINKLTNLAVVPQKIDYQENLNEYHKILRKNKKKSHVYLLDTLDFSLFYVPPTLDTSYNLDMSDEKKKFFYNKSHWSSFGRRNDDWKHIFDYSSFVYVIGGPGYGKSLFLTKLINDYENANFLNCKDYLIIIGDLKSYKFIDGHPESVLNFLQSSMINETLMDEKNLSKEMIEYYLNMGRCLILLDALDEVEQNKRNKLHQKIVNYFESKNPNNKICITSRSRGFIPQNNHIVYEILPLDKRQIECYVNNIIDLGKFDRNDKNIFLDQANELIKKNFLNSFLVLSLLLNIFKAEREFPETKLDLYQKCFEIITYKREKDKSQHKYDWNLISYLMKDNTFIELAQMCYPNNKDIDKNEIMTKFCKTYSGKYNSEVETERAVEQFLVFCSDRTELFVPSSGENKYKFFHRSFFEYFYSQYIFLRINEIEKIYNAMKQFDVDSEIFELVLASLKQKDEYKYQKLIDYLFSKAKEEIENSKNNNYEDKKALTILTLGMQVIDDIKYKNLYIEYLVKYKTYFIRKSKQRFINDKIFRIILSNEKYLKKVNEIYEIDAKSELLLKFLRNFIEIKLRSFKGENKDISQKNDIMDFKRHFIMQTVRYGSFYMKSYYSDNTPNILDYELTDQKVNDLLEMCTLSFEEINKYKLILSKYHKLDEKEKGKMREIINNLPTYIKEFGYI